MGSSFPNDHPSDKPQMDTFLNTFVLIASLVTLARWFHYHRRAPKVTSVGFWPIPYLGSWIAGIKFMLNPVGMVQQGVAKTKNDMFRIATLSDEFVVVTSRDKVAEYLKQPDSVLNMQDGANDQQQIEFTMGYGVAHRTYHNIVVRKQVTQKIPQFTSPMASEVLAAFEELIGRPKEFTPIALYNVIAMTVARASNKVYVGGPYYRDVEYLKNATDYAQAVVISAEILRLFPRWAKSIIVKWLPVTTCMRKAVKFLGPEVEARLNDKYPEDSKPDDLIQWLIDAAPPVERTVYQIVERVMALNVASIHTTTMTLTGALYSLAAEPEKYAATLRAEVQQNIEDGQITYQTTQKLVHMESFLRESARMNVSGLAAMQRNAKQSFTFSDGTVIPAGAKLVAPSRILHRDPSVHKNPDEFDGFRFVVREKADAHPAVTKSMVNTGTDFHLFGHGRHPCPGRFFATHEMKLMFATLLLRYDFKLAPGTKPKEIYVATMALPDTMLKVLFKARD